MEMLAAELDKLSRAPAKSIIKDPALFVSPGNLDYL